MAQYTVAKGDSLWSLAHRHLGGGPRWPAIRNYHNEQAARFNSNNNLIPIVDDNLIYVGQTLMLPPRVNDPNPGTGQQGTAKTLAKEIDMKINYYFGNGEAPIIYTQEASNCLIKAEMRGCISIEVASIDRYRQNLELLMAKDATHCKQKLNEIYTPAFSRLTEKPDLVFNGNTVTITPKGSANTKVKPYMIHMSPKSKAYMAGAYKAEPVTGTIEFEGRKFNYKSDIEFFVEVKIKSDQFVDRSQRKQRSFMSGVVEGLEQAVDNVYDTFTNKKFLAEIGQGFWQAGKISALAHTGSALKAYAIFDVATGGPVTTTAMVAAGTPAGQKVLLEFIPSMNPGTLPTPSLYGFWGWLAGTKIDEQIRR